MDFLRQMGYREYGRYLSFHFPFTHERSLLEHLRACPWNFDQSLFKVRPLTHPRPPPPLQSIRGNGKGKTSGAGTETIMSPNLYIYFHVAVVASLFFMS